MSLLWSFYLSIKGSKKMSKKLRVLTLIGALCLSCSAFADNDNKDELKKEIIQLERDTYELIEGSPSFLPIKKSPPSSK